LLMMAILTGVRWNFSVNNTLSLTSTSSRWQHTIPELVHKATHLSLKIVTNSPVP
jgi:hypothetical protein